MTSGNLSDVAKARISVLEAEIDRLSGNPRYEKKIKEMLDSIYNLRMYGEERPYTGNPVGVLIDCSGEN